MAEDTVDQRWVEVLIRLEAIESTLEQLEDAVGSALQQLKDVRDHLGIPPRDQ